MQTVSVISPDQFISMPWKNGLGSTLALAKRVLPGENEFSWRLSIADVTTDGPFSRFENYDRTLVLLGGKLGYDAVDVSEPEQAFHEDWEARERGMARSVGRSGVTIDWWRHVRELIPPQDYWSQPVLEKQTKPELI